MGLLPQWQDVYSYAMVLWSLLTLETPWESMAAAQVGALTM